MDCEGAYSWLASATLNGSVRFPPGSRIKPALGPDSGPASIVAHKRNDVASMYIFGDLIVNDATWNYCIGIL